MSPGAKRIIRHERALLDLEAAADYLSQESSLETGLRFFAAAEETFSRLAEMPGMGKVRATLLCTGQKL